MNSFVYKGKVYFKKSCMHKEARLIQNMPTKQKGLNICFFKMNLQIMQIWSTFFLRTYVPFF